MASPKLEQRVAALEEELASLKSKLDPVGSTTPWWQRIAGSFRDDPIYAEAMKLGREYRQSQKPARPRARKKTR